MLDAIVRFFKLKRSGVSFLDPSVDRVLPAHKERVSLRTDEQSRKAFYSAALSLGLVRSESHSTSERSSRGRK